MLQQSGKQQRPLSLQTLNRHLPKKIREKRNIISIGNDDLVCDVGPMFRALKMALKYLLDKQYNTDISELTRIFGGEAKVI